MKQVPFLLYTKVWTDQAIGRHASNALLIQVITGFNSLSWHNKFPSGIYDQTIHAEE